MIIAATSDLHGYLPDPPPWPYDVVIIAGDIMPDKRPIELQGNWIITRFAPWVMELGKPAYWTWGNHDLAAERLLVDPAWMGLVDRAVDIICRHEAVNAYFTPWVPNLPRWAYAFDGDVPDRYREAIPDGTQILVSHGPPYGFGDATNSHISSWEHVGVASTKQLSGTSSHVGSASLMARLNKIQPPIIICGHIHEGRGEYETDWKGTIYNVAALDRRYQPRLHPWTRIDTDLHRLSRQDLDQPPRLIL